MQKDVKKKETDIQNPSSVYPISIRVEKQFLDRFDEVTGYFAYNRTEGIKEGMRMLYDNLIKKKLKIEKLKR